MMVYFQNTLILWRAEYWTIRLFSVREEALIQVSVIAYGIGGNSREGLRTSTTTRKNIMLAKVRGSRFF